MSKSFIFGVFISYCLSQPIWAMMLDTDLGRSELHEIAFMGDPARLQAEIERLSGAGILARCIDAQDVQHRTPLHYSVKSGNVACVGLLIGAGADPNLQDTNPNKQVVAQYSPESNTPLDFAVKQGNILCVKMLLRSDSMRATTLYRACDRGIVARNHVPKKRGLSLARKDNGALEFPDDSQFCRIDECCRIILNSNKLTSEIPEGGTRLRNLYLGRECSEYTQKYPLHAAVQNGDLKACQSIIEEVSKGGQISLSMLINSLDCTDYTSLIYAVQNNDDGMTELLLKSGCDKSVMNKAIWIAAKRLVNSSFESIKIWQTFFEKKKTILKLLVQYGADINTPNEQGELLLHRVVMQNDLNAVKFLVVECNASLAAKNSLDQTAQQVAEICNYPSICSYLESLIKTPLLLHDASLLGGSIKPEADDDRIVLIDQPGLSAQYRNSEPDFAFPEMSIKSQEPIPAPKPVTGQQNLRARRRIDHAKKTLVVQSPQPPVIPAQVVVPDDGAQGDIYRKLFDDEAPFCTQPAANPKVPHTVQSHTISALPMMGVVACIGIACLAAKKLLDSYSEFTSDDEFSVHRQEDIEETSQPAVALAK